MVQSERGENAESEESSSDGRKKIEASAFLDILYCIL